MCRYPVIFFSFLLRTSHEKPYFYLQVLMPKKTIFSTDCEKTSKKNQKFKYL